MQLLSYCEKERYVTVDGWKRRNVDTLPLPLPRWEVYQRNGVYNAAKYAREAVPDRIGESAYRLPQQRTGKGNHTGSPG